MNKKIWLILCLLIGLISIGIAVVSAEKGKTSPNILLPGTVFIFSNPSGAEIFIDDIDRGIVTPNAVTNLYEGTHTYKLTLAGYLNATGQFGIIGGQTTTLSVKLMVLKDSNWNHGTDFNVEDPLKLYRTDRKGSGITYWEKNNTFNWFHIAIPTTIISDGKQNKLGKIFVLFKTDGNTKIRNIHIYDGPVKIKSYDGLNLSGNHGSVIDALNTFDIDPPKNISKGLGISVGVEFGNKDNIGMPYPGIIFTSAGANFYQ